MLSTDAVLPQILSNYSWLKAMWNLRTWKANYSSLKETCCVIYPRNEVASRLLEEDILLIYN